MNEKKTLFQVLKTKYKGFSKNICSKDFKIFDVLNDVIKTL